MYRWTWRKGNNHLILGGGAPAGRLKWAGEIFLAYFLEQEKFLRRSIGPDYLFLSSRSSLY